MVLSSTALGLITTLLFLVGLVAAGPGHAARMYRVGYVAPGSPNDPGERAFRQELRHAGYVEGQNVIIDARFAHGRQTRLPELVDDVIKQKVDVLVVVSTRTALAAKKATTTIPTMFASVFDPVAAGRAVPLAPGRKHHGLGDWGRRRLRRKWVELLKDAVPDISQAAVLWHSANPSSARSAGEIQAAAQSMDVKLDMFDAGNARTLDRALAAIGAGRAQGIIVAPDPYFNATRTKVVQFAASKRLPAVYLFASFAEVGGLLAYGPIHVESFRTAPTYVDKILKGAKPADLPVEQPTKFELVINRKTARALGLTISPSLLLRADRIIE